VAKFLTQVRYCPKRQQKYFFTALVATMLVALALPATGLAQETERNRVAGALIEEIIVTTARKRGRAEAVQEVPIAVTAFGADQLDALAFRRLDDLSFLMPNVQLEDVGTFPGVQNFSIRGQGINSSIPSVDPTVGVFVDGVYIGSTFGVITDTFDLESIEVLRGPQGLLFGRNVTGGAVLLRSKRPGNEPGVRVRADSTNEDEYGVAMALEGPISGETLQARVVAMYDQDEGYFPNPTVVPPEQAEALLYINPATGRDVGRMRTKMVRPSLAWRPSDGVEWILLTEMGEAEGDGAVWASVTAQRAGAQDEFTTTLDEMGFTDIRWSQVTLETNVDTDGNGTLTNIAAYRYTNVESAVDIDGTATPIFSAVGDTRQDQISNELRWSGQFGDNWAATLGVYGFSQDIRYNEGRIIQGGAVTLALGGTMNAKNFGVFWSNDFFFGNDWTLTAGLRWTDESKTANIFTAGCFDIQTFDCNSTRLRGDWDNITPKLGFEKRLSDDMRVYGFWSQGYRSGGFNFRNARPDVIPPGPTDEEQNNTFELGFKSELMDRRMRLNVAVFHNQIDDIQRELNLPDPFVVVLQGTINAGDVTIQGIEADLAWLINENFSINASVGFQDGEYDRVNPDFESFLGEELPRLAPGNGSVGFSWDIPVGNSLINLSGDWSYRDQNFYNDSNTEFFEEQERVNLRGSWFSADDRWQVTLYGKNLTDEPNWGNLTSIAGLFTAGPMQKGRLYGLEVDFRYQ